MEIRYLILAAALAAGFFVSGCCSERVYRCPDGRGDVSLSGRYNGCGPTEQCSGCGHPIASCLCHPWETLKRKMTCGHGCGEVYWGEWCSDPPDACDPCNQCGQFTGKPCCCPKKWHNSPLNKLSGGRFGAGVPCGDACADGSCEQVSYDEAAEAEMYNSVERDTTMPPEVNPLPRATKPSLPTPAENPPRETPEAAVPETMPEATPPAEANDSDFRPAGVRRIRR